MSTNPLLNIVTALYAEAKPIINSLQLKKIQTTNLPNVRFPIFVNKDKTIYLIVTGIGKINAACATTFLHMLNGAYTHPVFLNIGIAGSHHYDLGTAVLAHKIVEASTQRCWYPFVEPIKRIQQTILITHDSPQKLYPQQGMVDMEAAGFFSAATNFVTQEHIQVLKIISDNADNTIDSITVERVEYHISQQLLTIQQVISYLLTLSTQEAKNNLDIPLLEKFHQTWHFSHHQKIQLKKILHQWQLWQLLENAFDYCQTKKTSAEVINQLTQKLNSRCEQYANNLY